MPVIAVVEAERRLAEVTAEGERLAGSLPFLEEAATAWAELAGTARGGAPPPAGARGPGGRTGRAPPRPGRAPGRGGASSPGARRRARLGRRPTRAPRGRGDRAGPPGAGGRARVRAARRHLRFAAPRLPGSGRRGARRRREARAPAQGPPHDRAATRSGAGPHPDARPRDQRGGSAHRVADRAHQPRPRGHPRAADRFARCPTHPRVCRSPSTPTSSSASWPRWVR